VELLGAAAAWLAWSRHGLAWDALAELAFVDLLLALAFIDLDTWLLPNVLTWPLVGAGLVAAAAGVAPVASLRASALGAVVGFGAFAAVAAVGRIVTGKEALGFGDVWLLAGLGAWLGAPALLPVVLLASVQGSVYGLALVALGRSHPAPQEPPGPDDGSDAAPLPDDGADGAGDAEAPAAAGAAGEDEEAWVPPRHAVPFGPFLVAAALEWLYLAGPISTWIPALGIFR
jgi:leader peptidase (prepilin peptidase)/N-methyltransferase